MQSLRLTQTQNPALTILLVTMILAMTGCGAKGDPKPNQRHPPTPCAVRAIGIRTFEVTLPTEDVQGNRLSGFEAIRIYYLSLGAGYPSPMEVYQQGDAIMERRRPDIPGPGRTITVDLANFGRPSGWLVVVPYRVGNIAGVPSQVLAWVAPVF
jgi:hypothetical protein